MIKKVMYFFDKLEDRVRISLSHHPIPYAIVGGVGVVLFWKGVWETAEFFPILDGPGSITLGVVILLITGLMVSVFIGDSIIISGFNHEKKLAEKTEMEVREEINTEELILERLDTIEEKLDHPEKSVK